MDGIEFLIFISVIVSGLVGIGVLIRWLSIWISWLLK